MITRLTIVRIGLCMGLIAACLGCRDSNPQIAQFRVLSWNVANCGDDGEPPVNPGDNNELDDARIGKFVAEQARLRFANVILLQEITQRATMHTVSRLGDEWECQWRSFYKDGLATCVQGSMAVTNVGTFRQCGPYNPAPPKPFVGTCPDYQSHQCYYEGFGYLQVQYKAQTITNVHVQLGGINDQGLPGQALQQIVALHNNIAKSGIIGGDFNWSTPHDCSSLAPNATGTSCSTDWYLTTNLPDITLVTQPGPDHESFRHKVDHIATVQKPLSSPGVFSQVLGYGQAHDTCTNLGCPDANRPCSNHCMVHAAFSLPPANIHPAPAPP